MEAAARPQTQYNVARQNLAFWALALLLGLAMTLGGGGSRYPLQEMIVQLAALPALAIGFGHIRDRENWRAIRVPVLLLLGAIALVIIQIIPLPPAIWQGLPGREQLAEIAELTGQAESWRSWSINPELTMQAGISLIIPLAIVLCAGMISNRQRHFLIMLVTVLVLTNVLVAFMQAVSGGDSFYLYDTSHKGLPIGLFANRNHTAQLLLMGMFVLAGLFFAYGDGRIGAGPVMVASGLLLMLTFSVVATNSRTVSLLLLPALLFLVYWFLPPTLKSKKIALVLFIGFAGGLLLLFILATGEFSAINNLVERYAASDDHRFEFWPDVLRTFQAYMPFGSGLGTFDMAFRANEGLDIVGTHYVNNAHNDYLEIGIETGLFGLALLALFLLWFAKRLIELFGWPSSGHRNMAIFCAAAIIGLGLHSLVDYPLRSYAIAAPAALLLAIFALAKAERIKEKGAQ